MDSLKARVIVLAIFYFLWINAEGQQLPFNLKELSHKRIEYNINQKNRINEYLKTVRRFSGDTLRKPSFLITSISPSGIPIYRAPLNADAAITTGVNTLQNLSLGINLEGENMLVGIWDDGYVKDHIELGNRILSKEGSTPQTHATHVTGTILSTGINAQAKGMAPKANATTWYFDNDDAEMAALAKPDQTGLLFSNHSYGTVTGWTKIGGAWMWTGDASISNDEDYRHGFYGETAQVVDQIAYLAPFYTIVWAAGNDRTEVGNGSHPPDCNGGTGYDCIIPDAVAKNIITVGAVNKVPSYLDQSSVVMSNFSSWGPTDDGRIKPDVVGAGVSVFSLSAVGTNQYTVASGTSMATPNVCGSLVLVQELYSKLHSGNFMRASTLKALAIHTTKEAGSYPGPDYSYGWGLLNVEAAAKILLQNDNVNNFVKEVSLGDGQTYTMDLLPQANQKITITICWTDPAGSPVGASLDPTNQMLVNDLDVRLIDDAGNVQLPWILNPASPALQATRGDNFRDNVEKIEFNNPLAKKYTIRVTHKGKLTGGTQIFSLVVTNKSTTESGVNYYWISGTGNWNDAAHWSSTTGGVSVNMIPTEVDNVMFDENSFPDLLPHTVSLLSDASCKRLTWVTDKTVVLALNTHRLKIKRDLIVASKSFSITGSGVIEFYETGDHLIDVQHASLMGASLEFNGGTSTINGDLSMDRIDVKQGMLTMQNHSFAVKEIIANANTSLDFSGATIDSIQYSLIDKSVKLTSVNTTLKVRTIANLNWDNVRYDGLIDVARDGHLMISGSDSINQLTANKGAIISITGGHTEYFNDIGLSTSADSAVTINANGKASINFNTHQKYCFDNLIVNNVDVVGKAVVNAGLNSTVSNASNWLQQDCNIILFADFETDFNCVNAFTSFTDRSNGDITSWVWNFGDNESQDNTSVLRNPFHVFSKAGLYNVELKVANSTLVHSYTKALNILQGNQDINTIVASKNILASFRIANHYQWFMNNEPIEDAVNREYSYNGEPGVFVVVITDGDCNDASQPFVVTAVNKEENSLVTIFPNPAYDVIHINAATPSFKVIVYDALGRVMLTNTTTSDQMIINTQDFSAGLYTIELQLPAQHETLKKKIIIKKKD